MKVPWAEPGSGFTVLFEALVIDWLKEASTLAVSRQMKLSWNAIDGIMQRAVNRGLQRRAVYAPKQIGVDETPFRKRHDYVTVVSDKAGAKVLHVADERTKEEKGTDPLSPLQEQRRLGEDQQKAHGRNSGMLSRSFRSNRRERSTYSFTASCLGSGWGLSGLFFTSSGLRYRRPWQRSPLSQTLSGDRQLTGPPTEADT